MEYLDETAKVAHVKILNRETVLPLQAEWSKEREDKPLTEARTKITNVALQRFVNGEYVDTVHPDNYGGVIMGDFYYYPFDGEMVIVGKVM